MAGEGLHTQVMTYVVEHVRKLGCTDLLAYQTGQHLLASLSRASPLDCPSIVHSKLWFNCRGILLSKLLTSSPFLQLAGGLGRPDLGDIRVALAVALLPRLEDQTSRARLRLLVSSPVLNLC